MPDRFRKDLVAHLPRLRSQAAALARNRADAEDLVQDTVVNALATHDAYEQGTNLGAWLHSIMRSRFISIVRRQRCIPSVEALPERVLAVPALHEDRMMMQELAAALHRLPAPHRAALVAIGMNGPRYEALAQSMGCPVGTAKTRVFRARSQLKAWMAGDRADPAPRPRGRPRKAVPLPPVSATDAARAPSAHAAEAGAAPIRRVPRRRVRLDQGRAEPFSGPPGPELAGPGVAHRRAG